MLRANKNFKAFTLIELLVVVAIIGILAAVGTVAYQGYISGANATVVKTYYKAITKKSLEVGTMCSIEDTVKLKNMWDDKTSYDVPCYNNSLMWFFQLRCIPKALDLSQFEVINKNCLIVPVCLASHV